MKNILNFFLNNSVLNKSEKTELFSFLEQAPLSRIGFENINDLNRIMFRLDSEFRRDVFGGGTLDYFICSALFDLKNEILDYKKNSFFYCNKAYQEEDILKMMSVVQDSFSLEIIIEHCKKNGQIDSESLIKTCEIKDLILDFRNNYTEIYNNFKSIYPSLLPIENLRENNLIEHNNFMCDENYKNIKNIGYICERIFGFYSAEEDNRYTLTMERLKKDNWVEDEKDKREIAINILKMYFLSLEKSLIAKIYYKYVSFLYVNFTKHKINNLEDKDLRKRAIAQCECLESYKHQLSKEEKEQKIEENYRYLLDNLVRYKNKIQNTFLEDKLIREFFDGLLSSVNVILNVRKKGFGLVGEFNNCSENNFTLNKIEENHWMFSDKTGRNCSFKSKESFMIEMQSDYVRKALFPYVEEDFIIQMN